ncbi:MAG: SUMF1/EgtB/PvdO family nonheme iron enzyme [Magnetococcales bacterium]|nr:SUMF1/EgtB/PvdO family nonheme iron enzyme [Magnetococcales bacterium]
MPVMILANQQRVPTRTSSASHPATRLDHAPESSHPGTDEAQRLLAIARAITATMPNSAPLFTRWNAELATLLTKNTADTPAGEERLEALSMELRQIWLRFAHTYGDAHLKSPPQGVGKRLPGGERARFTYERCVYPNHLESRCRTYHAAHPDWEPAHLVSRCGMAALITLLHAVMRVCKPTPGTPLRLTLFGGYFETTRALRMFPEPLFLTQRTPSQPQLFQTIREGKNDLLLLEPVPYDWEMEPLDLTALLQAVHARTDSPMRMIIVDSTIVGPTFPMAELLDGLRMTDPPLVVQFHSALKLDQEGLELANAGVLTLYAPRRSPQRLRQGERMAGVMRSDRKLLGNALSMDEMAILDIPFFLHSQTHHHFCQGVFHNNRVLARAIPGGGIFSRVVHPSLGPGSERPWAVAPFVIFHFRQDQDRKENHARLIDTLKREAKRRGFALQQGMSFGFRSHRFEIILPNEILHPDGQRSGVLKVAMGHRMGVARDGVIALLQEIAALPDFAALERSFPSTSPDLVCEGHYLLMDTIGEGSFGAVRKAASPHGPGVFAIKRATTETGRKLLAWEAENLQRLRGGPHILALHEYRLEPDGSALLVTDYLDGGDLKRWVRARGRLHENEALGIMRQMAEALAFAHALVPPIVHRDIKPDNILGRKIAANRMTWFLADWGLAASWRDDRSPRVSGTERYTAPEVWKKKRYPVSDVYSLGMTLYFMLFGQPAYNGSSEVVVCGQTSPQPVVIPPGCPDHLRQLLSGTLEKNPKKRWSVARVLAHLGQTGRPTVARLAMRLGKPEPKTWTARHRDFAMEFVWIPAGRFGMGMATGHSGLADRVMQDFDHRSMPLHEVRLEGFWMARFPVTRGQFHYFLRDSGYRTTADREGWAKSYDPGQDGFTQCPGGNWERTGFVQGEDHPVVNVSHDDAMEFAQWLSFRCGRVVRLPSEAQWEHACRAGTATRYHWGDDATPEQANFGGHHGGTTPVTRFAPNGFGLFDMHGNVYEWLLDWYDEHFYTISDRHEPLCRESDSGERVLRGGSWHASAARMRSAGRDRYAPHLRDADIGFRLAGISYPWEN